MRDLEDRAQLVGKRAVIVGGGGGLGEATAIDLAAAGVRVALCDRNKEALDSTVAKIRSDGGEVSAVEVLDARDADALTGFFRSCDKAFGGALDVLCNVVGGTFRAPFEESTPKAWDALMRTNFIWLLASHQLAIPRMRAASRGSIINFTSIEAHRAAPGYAIYAAMKAAVASLTSTLAVELGPDNIRVNCIAPDVTPTPGAMATPAESMTFGQDPALETIKNQIAFPMARQGRYEDVGGVALFPRRSSPAT